MNSRDFVYWLQGYFELAAENATLTTFQVTTIKNHLAMVFKHEIDPSYEDERCADCGAVVAGGWCTCDPLVEPTRPG